MRHPRDPRPAGQLPNPYLHHDRLRSGAAWSVAGARCGALLAASAAGAAALGGTASAIELGGFSDGTFADYTPSLPTFSTLNSVSTLPTAEVLSSINLTPPVDVASLTVTPPAGSSASPPVVTTVPTQSAVTPAPTDTVALAAPTTAVTPAVVDPTAPAAALDASQPTGTAIGATEVVSAGPTVVPIEGFPSATGGASTEGALVAGVPVQTQLVDDSDGPPVPPPPPLDVQLPGGSDAYTLGDQSLPGEFPDGANTPGVFDQVEQPDDGKGPAPWEADFTLPAVGEVPAPGTELTEFQAPPGDPGQGGADVLQDGLTYATAGLVSALPLYAGAAPGDTLAEKLTNSAPAIATSFVRDAGFEASASGLDQVTGVTASSAINFASNEAAKRIYPPAAAPVGTTFVTVAPIAATVGGETGKAIAETVAPGNEEAELIGEALGQGAGIGGAYCATQGKCDTAAFVLPAVQKYGSEKFPEVSQNVGEYLGSVDQQDPYSSETEDVDRIIGVPQEFVQGAGAIVSGLQQNLTAPGGSLGTGTQDIGDLSLLPPTQEEQLQQSGDQLDAIVDSFRTPQSSDVARNIDNANRTLATAFGNIDDNITLAGERTRAATNEALFALGDTAQDVIGCGALDCPPGQLPKDSFPVPGTDGGGEFGAVPPSPADTRVSIEISTDAPPVPEIAPGQTVDSGNGTATTRNPDGTDTITYDNGDTLTIDPLADVEQEVVDLVQDEVLLDQVIEQPSVPRVEVPAGQDAV